MDKATRTASALAMAFGRLSPPVLSMKYPAPANAHKMPTKPIKMIQFMDTEYAAAG